MKPICLERNILLSNIDEYLMEEDEFLNSSYEVISEDKYECREIQDLNYIEIKKLGVRLHHCTYEVYDSDIADYEVDCDGYTLRDVESGELLYQEFNCTIEDIIYNYLSYENDENSLDDFDNITCKVMSVKE